MQNLFNYRSNSGKSKENSVEFWLKNASIYWKTKKEQERALLNAKILNSRQINLTDKSSIENRIKALEILLEKQEAKKGN